MALDQAMLAIRTGQCNAAVVVGLNLNTMPAISVQYNGLNMLSPDGACKAFDEAGIVSLSDMHVPNTDLWLVLFP